jgi:hypothetical protein
MFVRAYLRASTDDQDANRARDQLKAFAAERGLSVAAWYVENESGAKLSRPELFRLLADAQPGDILLVEQVDRLSRLTSGDWEKLKEELTTRQFRVVALDLPTSWMMATASADEFSGRMFEAIKRHAARYARCSRSQGLRRSAPTSGAGTGQGRGVWALQGAAGGHQAQCGHRQHAQGQALMEFDTERHGLQPRHHCQDCKAVGQARMNALRDSLMRVCAMAR